MNNRVRGIFSPKIAIGVAAFASVGIGTVAVYKMLERSGESAIRMIPADAALVMSLDTSPSPSQVRLYNEISQAMKDSGVNDFVDKLLAQADGGKGAFKSLRAQVKGSFAIGAWGNLASGNPDWVAAVALENPGKAETLVAGAQGIRAESHNSRTFYSGKGAPAVITFFDSYALISNKFESAERAIEVANGREKSVYDETTFQEAREALPQDAGLMVFLNGKALGEMDAEARKAFESLGVDNNGWFAMGTTLRDEGILIDCSSPLGKGGFPAALNRMENLSFASLEHFPAGALGVASLSSPAGLYNMVREAMKTQDGVEAELDKGIASLEQETGLDFESDIVPGFRGEANFAMYPPEGENGSPRILFSLDNQHGGRATALATRVMQLLNEKKIEGPQFTKSENGGWTVFTASDKSLHVAIGNDKVIVGSTAALIDQVSSSSGTSLLYSDAFTGMSENKSAKFVLTIDTDRVASLLQKSMGDGPPIREFLTGKPLSMTWTTANNACKTEILIPVNLPALIRFGGKTMRGTDMEGLPMPSNGLPQTGHPKIVIKAG